MSKRLYSKIQWNFKKLVHNRILSSRRGAEASPAIFHLTHHKSGSQWIRQMLTSAAPDRIITPEPLSGHISNQKLVAGNIYPTVYLTKSQLDKHIVEAGSDFQHHQFFVMRDLRDTLVSLYFSLKYSHKVVSENVRRQKEALKDLSDIEGILYLLESSLDVQADIQSSWIDSGVMVIRYEELLSDPVANFSKIFAHCELGMSAKELKRLVQLHSFESMTGGRNRGEEDISQHQRKGISGDWQNYFDDEIKNRFKEKYGEILITTGYEKDFEW